MLNIIPFSFQEKVLHNIMSIFTFMGMSVLRQDDTYSFQIIKRTVESIIPALIKVWKSASVRVNIACSFQLPVELPYMYVGGSCPA